MNSPKSMQDSNLNNKVICCCYFVQKVLEKELRKNKKVEDIAHNQTQMTDLAQPVIDATNKSVKVTLENNGTISRGDNSKSKKSPEDIKKVKRLQDVANQEKLQVQNKNQEQR